MSQQIHEQLSALMDGELTREETLFLLRRAGHDPGIATRWSRWHVARHALRRQEGQPLRPGFARAILLQVESEAAPVRPRQTPWLRWASGGAIAASVAVAALVLTAPREVASPGVAPLVGVPAAPSTRTLGEAPSEFRAPLLAQPLSAQPVSATTAGFNAPGAPIDPRLQSYLVRHYDAAGTVGQSALMPYVLLVVPSQPQAATPPPREEVVEGRR
ncbi:MAG TPA: sigma-E factor negative regulatory protein [Dokdonella sp.]|uniref:sigma-E factor negative regulatory protein n=1 Tax=Dokdonella sp. TaxID=2291710 RepID=UPI0025C30C6E|nr:sigma-E factor negative regulatory protein [Dokdonella sp.]MBX3693262.1 sigma-E factor negative regulatory protein [Dokdonella sp.]MCW5567768.1 sigma-E factor negative regulatory protein [Dokdonella sp.]HNR92457.1 sigma-E factor negative regulatory protein [Dokdonella sp.]